MLGRRHRRRAARASRAGSATSGSRARHRVSARSSQSFARLSPHSHSGAAGAPRASAPRVTVATAASNDGGPLRVCSFRRAWPHQLGGVVGCAASFLVLFVSFISSKQIRNISCSYNFSHKFLHVDFFCTIFFQ